MRIALGGNLARALLASGWFYGSRALVFGWALMLAHEFSIGAYGYFAMALAMGTMIGTPIDSYFQVRSPRVSDDEFAGDRSARVFLGLALIFVGMSLWPFTYVGGFAVAKAGIDVCFQATRSALVRAGRPEVAQRSDAVRQVAGVLLGAAYVLFYPGATLTAASLVYLGGLALPVVGRLNTLVAHAPHLPQLTARNAAIVAESVGGVAYAQAGVVFLGFLHSPGAAGYYSFGLTIVLALSGVGLSFGSTFHESLRTSGGASEAGPPLRASLMISGLSGLFMAVTALGLWLVGKPESLWLTFAILAPVAFTRSLSAVATVVLLMRHRDFFRLGVTWACLTLIVALLAVLTRFGGPGAASAFLAADVVMASAYAIVAFRRGSGLAR